MTRIKLIIVSLLTISLGSTVFGQGRVDKDRILYKIWLTTLKIDNDTSLKYFVKKDTALPVRIIEIAYFKTDSLRKVSRLTNKENGTELTTYYFADLKPILISVSRNNFLLSEKTEIFEAISSFDNIVDTLPSARSLYLTTYKAEYYFYKDTVRYTPVVIYTAKGDVKNVRHDNKDDITEGMNLYRKAKQYLLSRK